MNNLCYVDPTLGPQINKLGAPDIYTGYMFAVECGSCFIGSCVAVLVVNSMNSKWAV